MQTSKTQRALTLRTALQSIYLTASYFIRNNLVAYASACAFGFLFSFIPVAILICIILIRILHASPSTLDTIILAVQQFSDIIQLDAVINTIRHIGTIGRVEVTIIITVIWMARRFFASIMDGMYRIFHRAVPPRPVASQIIIFGGEVLLVILIASLMFILVSAQTLLSLPIFDPLYNSFPKLMQAAQGHLITTLPYYISLLLISIGYRIFSRTKPHFLLCLFAGILCIISFWVAARIMNTVLNKDNIDIIYGVLSQFVLLLLDAFIFSILFFVFAEFIYVVQYFDMLLLGQLYIMPAEEKADIASICIRKLFIRPDYLLHQKENILTCTSGETIYTYSDTSMDVYYIAKGSIEMHRNNSVTTYSDGMFFGELACIMNKQRNEEAVSSSDCMLLRIDGSTFRLLLEQDSRAAHKALSQISDYFNRVYEWAEAYLL
ncbi:MAG: YihY/virulence factor BrkB family protein [Treponema sp.]|nr:YihY/virulence factor BrkB family protein [Treponema sp.]